jgi:hypothetical protein
MIDAQKYELTPALDPVKIADDKIYFCLIYIGVDIGAFTAPSVLALRLAGLSPLSSVIL